MKQPYYSSGIVAISLALACLLSGCERPDAPLLKAGSPCTVQFRRDALGAGANLPISPMTSGINGAETALSGTLKRATPDWIVIEMSGREITIPKSVILLIEQQM
jgi:hypothetical protein